jgi:hypothetical protein
MQTKVLVVLVELLAVVGVVLVVSTLLAMAVLVQR